MIAFSYPGVGFLIHVMWFHDVYVCCSSQLRLKYGRALKKGEHRLKVYLLSPAEKEVSLLFVVFALQLIKSFSQHDSNVM